MKTLEFTVNGVKCPLCDLIHNYKVKIEYEENSNFNNYEKPYYNFLIKEEPSGTGNVQVPVYEVDAYCPKKSSPFRIIVEPKIPVNSTPVNIIVTLA